MKLDGGVGSVRVVPIGMREGGDPAEKLLAEGPPEGPKQFKLPDERMLTQRREQNVQTIPVPRGDKPISSEPDFDSTAENLTNVLGPGNVEQDFLFTTPTINPLEALPVLPFMPNPAIPNQRNPFIDGFFDPMPQDTGGGISGLMKANMLKPAGILTITKSYDI
tara:strand:+ start:172 stop:663 length:492 start_codon:yes stop_codon:yes gene_type:complete